MSDLAVPWLLVVGALRPAMLLLSPLFCVLLPLLWCMIPATAVLMLAGRHWLQQGGSRGLWL
jgi:hypothetical protein